MCPEQTGRRPLLKAAAGGAVALGAAGATARIVYEKARDTPDDFGSSDGGLQLSAGDDSGVQTLEIVLGNSLLPRVSVTKWRSAHLPTTTHSMVGFTWSLTAEAPRIQIRSRIDGAWQQWRRAPVLHDLPDLDSGEGRGLTGTDLIWIGDSDGIQIHVEGQRPQDLTLVLLHPARFSSDVVAPLTRVAARSVPGAGTPVPAPALLSRAKWAADEGWRDGEPRYNDTIQQVHVHHTVNSNTYARDEVPALIRGMYRYHTHNLGWSDIAYNFLVDRFGRVWVGRYGGPAKPVRGAHTLGFNATSTGISVIGNFELTSPTKATLDAIAGVAAWKLDLYGRKPNAQVQVASEGSDKYTARQVVKLPAIDGHRDTNDTACPGQHLYDALPSVRTKATAIVNKYRNAVTAVTVTKAASIAGSPALGNALKVDPGTYTPADAAIAYTWLRNSAPIPAATNDTYTCVAPDIGMQLSVRVDLNIPGAESATQTIAASGPVTAQPNLVVTTKGRKGRAIVHVTVEPPPGASTAPTGNVVIVVNRRTQTVALIDGAAVGRFGHGVPYKAGEFPVSVDYGGDRTFTTSRTTATVTVR